jgi:phage gp29-like protein
MPRTKPTNSAPTPSFGGEMAFKIKDLVTMYKRLTTKEASTELMGTSEAIGTTHSRYEPALEGLTSAVLLQILDDARTLEPQAVARWLHVATRMLEREPQLICELSALSQVVAGAERKVSPPEGDESPRAREIALAVQRQIGRDSPLQRSASGIVYNMVGLGFDVAELIYDLRSAKQWPLAAVLQQPTRFFTQDLDGRTIVERGDLFTDPVKPILPGKAIIATTTLRGPVPIMNGLAWDLAWLWIIKATLFGSWSHQVQTQNQPVRLAKHAINASEKDIAALKKVLAMIGQKYGAVIREDMQVEVLENARGQANAAVHEGFIRYIDEIISKMVWASVMTSNAPGSTGSFAQSKTQADTKYDVIKARAYEFACAITDGFVKPWVIWHYGEDAPMPVLTIEVEEPADEVSTSQVVKNLYEAHVPLSASEVRQKCKFRDPVEGEEVIWKGNEAPSAPATPPATPGKGATPAKDAKPAPTAAKEP